MKLSGNEDCVSIKNIALEEFSGYQELSANVDGERLWFRFPFGLELEARAEIFLPLAMFEAMVRGVPVRVDKSVPISAKLAVSLKQIQSTFNFWNPGLSIVQIEAETTSSFKPTGDVISCFSGGVDSTYSYSCFSEEVTQLLLVRGFDGFGSGERWQENVQARQSFADLENKNLIAVDSNVRTFADARKLSWALLHGSVLAGIGVALSPKKFIIPASHTLNNLIPLGSHPLVDYLWGTESTTILHHGVDSSRTKKTEYISRNEKYLDHLQVCWRSTAGNCGECSKCVRTSVVLHILGKNRSSIPNFRDLKQLDAIIPDSKNLLAFVDDLIEFSERNSASRIEERLRDYRRNYLMRDAVDAFFKALLGDKGRRIVHYFRKPAWHDERGTVLPK